jgi:hypothetical protein
LRCSAPPGWRRGDSSITASGTLSASRPRRSPSGFPSRGRTFGIGPLAGRSVHTRRRAPATGAASARPRTSCVNDSRSEVKRRGVVTSGAKAWRAL